MKIRKSVFSGSWYPSKASECEAMIRQFLSGEKDRQQHPEGGYSGGIVPHAGWYFSGKIACRVMHHLQTEQPPDIMVVFGMHLHHRDPGYIMPEGAWETPFGTIPVAENLAQEIADHFSFVVETPDDFHQDNTIELQLPFVKYFFPDAKIVAIGVPPTDMAMKTADFIVEVASRLGVSIRVIGSTDLTHYGPNYGFSPKGTGVKALEWVTKVNDRGVIDQMLAMNPSGVIREARENGNACCAGAAAAAIAAGKKMGARLAVEMDYATSYDKSHGTSFVGYTGIVF
ncbi:MAG: AmmeMemoRadiSam system protein B [Pseudomonadota bacterium]